MSERENQFPRHFRPDLAVHRGSGSFRRYIINGFNDGYAAKYAGWNNTSTCTNPPNQLPNLTENDIILPSTTAVFSEKLAFAGDFFMDYFNIDDQRNILDQTKHSGQNTNEGGSVVAFVDGSAALFEKPHHHAARCDVVYRSRLPQRRRPALSPPVLTGTADGHRWTRILQWKRREVFFLLRQSSCVGFAPTRNKCHSHSLIRGSSPLRQKSLRQFDGLKVQAAFELVRRLQVQPVFHVRA